MTTTIGSLDLNAFSDLYSDSTQYFWFESNASATYGAGAHVTLVPDTSFISNPTGQNILMNTDGFSIRNGLLPMMTLDNNSLNFNVVDTTAGTFVPTATFSSTGAQIGQSSGAHSVIDEDGMQIYSVDSNDNLVPIAHLGYGPGYNGSGQLVDAPFYTFGTRTGAVGNYSVAEGNDVCANGAYSHAEGYETVASGPASHAEGDLSEASAQGAHAEGSSIARGQSSHSEGTSTVSGDDAHGEGEYTQVNGDAAHAEGYFSIANADYSHAQNKYTKASKQAQTALGTYNDEDTSNTTTHPSGTASYGQYAVIVGNGTANDARSNALTVDWSGNVCLALDTTAASGTTDGDLYAAINSLGWASAVIV